MTIDKRNRENQVLREIIRIHNETAYPVGSKHIADTLGLSSATIRSVMFDLEEQGYLIQPHTSAGRVPTDLAYRRYVDSLKSLRESVPDETQHIIRHYMNNKRGFEDVIETTSHIVAEITNYVGVSFTSDHRLYLDGTYHLLEQPEFRELERIRVLLRLVDEKDELLQIMSQDLEEGIKIRIGRENTLDELNQCTVITTSYRFNNTVAGGLGIIGPMRMKYETIVPIVEQIADITSEILREITKYG